MTDWKTDLWNLLKETDPDPVEDILGSGAAQPALGALASDPANYIFKTLDAPFSVVRGGIGAASLLAEGQGLQGIEQGQERWDKAIERMRESDLGPLGILKTPMELGLNVALDPTTWTGLGLAGKAAKGLRATAELNALAGRPVAGAVASGAARGLETAQWINDVPGKRALEGVIVPKAIPALGGKTIGLQPAVRAGARGLVKATGKSDLLDMTAASRIRGIKDNIDAADAELQGAGMHPGPPPAAPLAVESPLYHGSPTPGLATLASEIPLEERGLPNAASSMGVYFTPHQDLAKSYAARGRKTAADGTLIEGQVYRAENELTNPLVMEQHDFYSRFVRTDPASFEDARAFKEQAMASGHDGVVIYRDYNQQEGITRTAASLKPEEVQEVLNFRDVDVRPEHWHPQLDDRTNAFYDTPVPKVADAPAQTYREFLDTAEAARQADIDTIRGKGFDWEPGLSTDAILKITADDPQVSKIVKNWAADRKGDPLHVGGDARGVARSDLMDVLEKDAGITYTRSTVPSLLVAAWKSTALATPRFVFQNLQSNMMMQAVKGIRPTFDWREYFHAFQASRHGRIDVTADEILESSSVTQFARQELGKPHAPQEMFRGGSRGFAGNDKRYAANPLGELVGRTTKSQKLARLATNMVEPFEHGGMAVDAVARSSTWMQTTRDALTEMKPAFDQRVAAKLAEVGVTDEVFSTVNKIGLPEEGMFAQPLKQTFLDLGLSDGNANHLVRTWAGVANDAEKAGKVATNKIMFDYNRTNLDDLVGKFVPFHYWPSRALRFWGEESLRNPAIPLNYMRMTDGIEDAQNNPGMSARQKGFLHVMGTSLGFSLLMNPDALFGFSRLISLDEAFNEPEMEIDPLTGEEKPKDDSFTPQGETQLGGVLNWLKDKGFGLYPWLDSAFNVMGTYGNTFEPDFLPIRHKALVGAALNELRAFTGGDRVGAPYADAMGQLRQGISTAVSAFLPDGMEPWLAEPVMARAGGSSQEANLDTLIEHEIVAHNPGITHGQLLEIMSDPHSEQYEYAYQVVSGMGLITELMGVTLPLQSKMRHDARDVIRAGVETIQEEADREGVPPWEIAPSKDDLAFHAKYRRLTGKEYTPGDYETAKFIHDITRAPLEVKPLLIAEAEYKVLGTPKARGHYEAYYALLKGNDPSVAGLSDAGRAEMAARYIDTHPRAREAIEEIHALHDAYETSHPEFAEFKAWQQRMYNLSNQFGGNLTEYRRQAALISPNAARYFEDQVNWIAQTEPDPTKRDARLEQATTNMGAFIAITNKAKLRSMPGPIPGSPTTDTTLPSMEAPPPSYGGSRAGGTDWVKETRLL